MNGPHVLTLRELNNRVRQAIELELGDESLWVQAELSEVRISAKGHCFVELVERTEHSAAPVAKAKGVIMSHVFPLLRLDFEETTGQRFAAGLQVLLEVQASFSEVYGYSLIITNIDPTYTLGSLARKRKEILQRLADEGVLHLNQELPFPPLVQRVAVVSSATAAGYGDFCQHLAEGLRGFRFQYKLFPAAMQGEATESSLIAALDQIAAKEDQWDLVVIVRGGGAVSDLNSFDTYELANHCAQFPLPILVGIGHERDNTVLDEVAHRSLKTPTAVADFLVEHLHGHAQRLEQFTQRLGRSAEGLLQRSNALHEKRSHQLVAAFTLRIERERLALERRKQQMRPAVARRMEHEHHRLQLLEQRSALLDPQRILNLGYSITLRDGRAVKNIDQLQPCDRLLTRLAHGTMVVEVVKTTPS